MKNMKLAMVVMFLAMVGCGGGGPDPEEWYGTYDLVWTCDSAGGCDTSSGIPPAITTSGVARICAYQGPATSDPAVVAWAATEAELAQDCSGTSLEDSDDTFTFYPYGPGTWECPIHHGHQLPYCPLIKTDTGFAFAGTYEVAAGETYDWSLVATRRSP